MRRAIAAWFARWSSHTNMPRRLGAFPHIHNLRPHVRPIRRGPIPSLRRHSLNLVVTPDGHGVSAPKTLPLLTCRTDLSFQKGSAPNARIQPDTIANPGAHLAASRSIRHEHPIPPPLDRSALTRADYGHNIFLVMATMTIRTTVAFDPATVARWDRLAKRWGVSKSEALRRALETAERSLPPASEDPPDFSGMTPLGIMDWLRDHPQVPPGWGESLRQELRLARERDAEIGDQREWSRRKVAEPEDNYGV